jgi:hypothetical protein
MDWIKTFMHYTEGLSSPPIFRLWSAIGTIGAAAERRVWVRTARSILYPNMFIALVAAPGVGKGEAIKNAEELSYACKKIRVAPTNVSRASIIDALAEVQQKRLLPDGNLIEYASLFAIVEELGVFIPAHDLAFLSVLTDIWNNPRVHRDKKRGMAKEIDIPHPQLSILAGSQPNFLASLLPEEAWGQGFMSRVILIYSALPVDVPLFDEREMDGGLRQGMIDRLGEISELYGQCQWEPEAQALITGWKAGGQLPVPEHSRLQNYCARRILHILKLSIIASLSRGNDLVIRHEDAARAIDWLLEAEAAMPDIFREMAQKSDAQVIQELHIYLWKEWMKGGKKPLHEARMYNFLHNRVPADKIYRVIQTAERANIIARVAGTENMYVPRAKNEHGVE